MKPDKNRQRGSILVVAIMVIMVMLIIAIPFLVKLSGQSRSAERSYRALSAFNLAEAGAERALWSMNQPFYDSGGGFISFDEDGNRIFGPADEAVGEWTGQYHGTIVENLSVEPNTRTLVSTGRMPFIGDGTVDRTVRVVLEQYFKSIWEFAFVVDDSFITRNNFDVASYDSSEGSYDPQNPGTEAIFYVDNHLDQSFYITSPAGPSSNIYGTVLSDMNTDPDSVDGVLDFPENTGGDYTKSILQVEYEFPSVNIFDLPPQEMFSQQGDESLADWFTSDFQSNYTQLDASTGLYNYQKQDFLPALGDINSGYYKGNFAPERNSSTTLTASDSGVYTSFNLTGGDVTIAEHVVMYLTGVEGAADSGTFHMVGSDIVIAEGGSLTLVLGNSSFHLEQGTYINTTPITQGLPADCIILGTDQFQPIPDDKSSEPVGVMLWENAVTISAALYVPRAIIDASQGQANIDLYGAATAYSMDMNNANINFYYDEDLANLDFMTGGIPYWRVVSWQEVIGQ